MLPQDLLRAAVTVLTEKGWTQGEPGAAVTFHARDHAGEPVPIYRPDKGGESRAAVNPAAASFSAYGAIVAAIHQAGVPIDNMELMWGTIAGLATAKLKEMALGGENHVHPLLAFNELKGQTVQNVIGLLQETAREIDKVTGVDTMPVQWADPLKPGQIVAGVIGDEVVSFAPTMPTHTGALAIPVTPVVVGQIGFPEVKPLSPWPNNLEINVPAPGPSKDERLPTVDWNKP